MGTETTLATSRKRLLAEEDRLRQLEAERDAPIARQREAIERARVAVAEAEREAAEQQAVAKRKKALELRAELRDRTAELNAALDELGGVYARHSVVEAALYALDGTRPSGQTVVLAGLVSRRTVDSRELNTNASTLRKLSEPAEERARRAELQRVADEQEREADNRRQAPRQLALLDARERDAQTARAGSPDPERLAQIAKERLFWSKYVTVGA